MLSQLNDYHNEVQNIVDSFKRLFLVWLIRIYYNKNILLFGHNM